MKYHIIIKDGKPRIRETRHFPDANGAIADGDNFHECADTVRFIAYQLKPHAGKLEPVVKHQMKLL